MKRNFGHGSTDNQAGRSERRSSPLGSFLATLITVVILGACFGSIFFMKGCLDQELSECIPCASERYNGEFEAGYQRKMGTVCLPCRIAESEWEFKVCPPEWRVAYLTKQKKAEEWKKTHLYNPKEKK